jgi:hypothetical protein
MNQPIDLKSENELRQEYTKAENRWAPGDYRGKSIIKFSRESS